MRTILYPNCGQKPKLYIRFAIRIMINNVHLRIQYYIYLLKKYYETAICVRFTKRGVRLRVKRMDHLHYRLNFDLDKNYFVRALIDGSIRH